MLANGAAPTPVEKRMAVVSRTLQSVPAPIAAGLASGAQRGRLDDLAEGIATLSKFLSKLEDDELDRVVTDHEDRIIASLKRRGRI